MRVIKMAAAENLQLIKNAYAAFQRGDITAILNSCDENVECLGVTGTEGVLPQAGLRRGRVAVAEFFKHVAETTGFTAFQPQAFVAQRDTVVAVGNYTARMRSSGQWMSSTWVMLFTVRNGKVVRFREYSDSAQIVRAYRSVAISA
jgi:ketosteroid isomerase-like protein